MQKTDTGWDWGLLLYTGTVTLHMAPNLFWRCTPRKLNTLVNVHMEITNGKSNKEASVVTGFIDDIL